MKKKKTSYKAKGVLDKYKATKTKGNLAKTGLKTLVDLLLGATVGAGIGASAGRAAVPVGILLIAGSHFVEEDTGVLRIAGAASIAYGIGKTREHQTIAAAESVNGFTLAGETNKAKTRLALFKNEMLSAFHLDNVFKKSEVAAQLTESIGAIDLSSLDVFEQNNKNQAIQFEIENSDLDDLSDEFDDDDEFDEDLEGHDLEDFSFAMIEEEPDLTNI